jgi:hypothetical protein
MKYLALAALTFTTLCLGCNYVTVPPFPPKPEKSIRMPPSKQYLLIRQLEADRQKVKDDEQGIVDMYKQQKAIFHLVGSYPKNPLKVGQTLQLLVEGTRPLNNIHWDSNNAQVATVDAHGLVTALKPGKTLVRAACISCITADDDFTPETGLFITVK